MALVSSFKIRQAVRKISQGEVIAYPTEAVFGLGCDPLNEEAVYRLLAIKKRKVEKGLILIASSLSQLESYLLLDKAIIKRIQKTWPGAVTWIIPVQSWVPEWLTGEHTSLAVRVTAHPIARQLCTANGKPLVSTSANTSSKPPAIKSWEVLKKLDNTKLFILPGQVGGLAHATSIYNVLNHQQIR
ncbi:MAG: threonylcarbamoyl-AMP synthase [Methylococcales symbiont of Iophon sp. n. MRB-2018]|nr:MAG: threonylcarbamoyl-AMP synthase [Methylococcales symbiont of Iophon sp. n. MRB-2018]KAF3980229.1 MAG: threonylcarbamoyl-AMP synthase [Methylococcales symbiont of Iophon sp. n. MRB-2018]